ncbi:winged helix-turn-helix domain-containing protein [Serratia odorifera]|uniref:Transcriptional regulatory protein, C-terminal domain protein n=2 Tax=Serratia odorifera TaxID=618 RepID=D4E247_SEROD|nr:winged helix-turn-helix domain-containing protein [Serratia odorifera]EFE96108.1 transcriptional regulatory protein, C-terminal domain protein [Serratia odorifera DSM 4582]PNK90722.1 hypothetical protein CEQ31_014040 [Serratia odorifera]RII71800.1 hypothetical protein DX901_12305 [Serratia odorifera]VDZ58321.1 Transcriptional regulatory protein, C terminal [Serratia odorifera]HEJ9097427.1 winged helix-turn-helix domain-containing protein [Serratia odorifera]
MNKTFLIDGKLVFHSDRNELVSVNHPDIKETLNGPCARCLTALLNAPGQIISQTELYKAGWGNSYKEVSPNTLYQNILLARKALRNVSDNDDEFIITVPRKGFRFNEVIPVSDASSTADQLPPHTGEPQLTGIVKGHAKTDGLAEHHLLDRLLIPASLIFIILSAVIFAMGVYRYDNTYHDDFSGDYVYFKAFSGCEIYLNKQEALPSSEIQNILNAWPVITSDCSKLPLRYLTAYHNHLRVFYLSCNTKDKADRICRSGHLRMLK